MQYIGITHSSQKKLVPNLAITKLVSLYKMALSISTILIESLKLTTKNPTLILSILLLYSLSSSLLFLFSNLSLTSLVSEITTTSLASTSLDPKSPEYASLTSSISKDVKQLLILETIIFSISFLIYSLFSFATIHVLSTSHNGEPLTSKILLTRLLKKLKGPMITRLYVTLFNLGYIFLVTFIISFIMFFFTWSTMVKIAVGVVLGLVGLHFYMYLWMVWSIGVVISVVEEEEGSRYGLDAISRASVVMKERRRKGGMLSLIVFLMMGVIYGVYIVCIKGGLNSHPSLVQLGFGVVCTIVSVALGLFQWAVVVVFYGDCMGEDRMKVKDVEGGFIYKVVGQDEL